MHPKSRLWMVVFAGVFVVVIAAWTMVASPPHAIDAKNMTASPHIAGSDVAARARLAAWGNLPLAFEANAGQTDPQVKFVARSAGYTLFLTGDQAVFALATGRSNKTSPIPPRHVVRLELAGSNPKPVVRGMDELPGKSNYFTGNDPAEWKTGVANYARVLYQDVYPGIDLIYYGNQGQLEYDFMVAPGRDPGAISWRVDSVSGVAGKNPLRAAKLEINPNGDLVVKVNGQEIRFHKPIAYQLATASERQAGSEGRKLVGAHYVLDPKNQVRVEVSAYDATRGLVIDPVISYSSYLGGSSADQAASIAVDDGGNVYLTGFTQSVDFPQVNQISGACLGLCGNGSPIAFVTKIEASGKSLIYSSYLGGSGPTQGNGIAVDSSGNAYLTGGTFSGDFPRVHQIAGACQGSCGTGTNEDEFVTKVNAAGNALVYSSLVGGSGDENIYNFAGIAVDQSGNAYLTGTTDSTDFPRVNQIAGACQGTCGTGSTDAFVTKVNAAGSALVYSSYLGGSGTEIGFGIAVDGAGNAYATGLIGSSDFPRLHQIPGACTGTCGSGTNYDIYATKINATGTALLYSSYLGGSQDDYGRGIAVDSAGNAYLAGRAGDGFPQVKQIAGACAQNLCDGFAAKINSKGTALVYSSRLGGSYATQAHAIAVDGSGSAYVTGETQSSDFPLVNPIAGACRGSCGSGAYRDGFVLKVNADGAALGYSSYLGGSGDDNGGSIVCNSSVAVDSSQNVYLSGCTVSADFPLKRFGSAIPNSIPGACKGSCGSGSSTDAFVMKISP